MTGVKCDFTGMMGYEWDVISLARPNTRAIKKCAIAKLYGIKGAPSHPSSLNGIPHYQTFLMGFKPMF